MKFLYFLILFPCGCNYLNSAGGDIGKDERGNWYIRVDFEVMPEKVNNVLAKDYQLIEKNNICLNSIQKHQ